MSKNKLPDLVPAELGKKTNTGYLSRGYRMNLTAYERQVTGVCVTTGVARGAGVYTLLYSEFQVLCYKFGKNCR